MAEQEDAVRWVAEFCYPEELKGAQTAHALREDRARLVMEKRRKIDHINMLKFKGAADIQLAADFSEKEVRVQEALDNVHSTTCALCERCNFVGCLSILTDTSTFNAIDEIRCTILDIDRSADKFCEPRLKWLKVYSL